MSTPANMFDASRLSASRALLFSKAWLSDPIPTATRLATEICRMSRISLADPNDPETSAAYHTIMMNTLIVGRWAMAGLPVVTLGHRTAAALMATRIKPDDAEEFVRAPWPAFAIRLPVPMLTVDDEGVLRDANLVLVTSIPREQVGPNDELQGGDRWWYKLVAVDHEPLPGSERMPPDMIGFLGGLNLWGFNTPTRYLATADSSDEEGWTRWGLRETISSDQRSDQMARSLIIACCLYLSGDPLSRAARGEGESKVTITTRSRSQRDGDELPGYTEHEIRSAITINLHHAIRDYVHHGGGTPAVQTLVAGHWKRQAFGTGRTERRIIHVHPYWRGPIDAPVSTRIK